MKSFSSHIKNLKLSEKEVRVMPSNKLRAQYNSDRFHLYKSLHKGPDSEALRMQYSPHCRFLKLYEDKGKDIFSSVENTAYYKMHRKYGKCHEWTINKIKKFIALYNNIKAEGYKEDSRVTVFEKPLISNKFNDTYEIWEGHHRVACCIYLGIKYIPVGILTSNE